VSAYREGFGPLDQKRAEVTLVRRRTELRASALARISAARLGRIVGALAGLGGLLAFVPLYLLFSTPEGEGVLAVTWFFGSAVLALLVHLAVSAVARRALSPPSAERRGDASRREEALEILRAPEPAALDALDPWPKLSAELAHLEAPALVLPLVLASLVLPLAVHAAVYFPFALLTHTSAPLAGFSVWMYLSAMVVGHAHVALAICAGFFGRKLAASKTDENDDEATRKAWVRAYWIAVGVASVPGILLLAVPTVLSLATGIGVIPLMFRAAAHLARREREVTDELEEEVVRIRAGLGVSEMEAVRQDLLARAEGRGGLEPLDIRLPVRGRVAEPALELSAAAEPREALPREDELPEEVSPASRRSPRESA
jgi:hypothetical protein